MLFIGLLLTATNLMAPSYSSHSMGKGVNLFGFEGLACSKVFASELAEGARLAPNADSNDLLKSASLGQVNDVTLYDIDGSVASLNGTYGGKKRMVIVGPRTCGRTIEAIEQFEGLASNPKFNDVTCLVCDYYDDDFAEYAACYREKETDRVKFFSPKPGTDISYATWAWYVYHPLGIEFHGKTPYIFIIDESNNLLSGTLDRRDVYSLLCDAFGISDPQIKTLSFETNGGSKIPDFRFRAGENIELPDPPEKDGYDFRGWYTDSACTVPRYGIVNGNRFSIQTDTKLYAKWEPLTTIAINVKGSLNQGVAREALSLVNEKRIGAGAQPLVWDSNLEQVAIQRAMEISCWYSDERPDGSSYMTALPSFASSNIIVAQNIGNSCWSAAEMIAKWASSSQSSVTMVNATNMLSTDFTSMAVACLVEPDGSTYWVGLFSGVAGQDTGRRPDKETVSSSITSESSHVYLWIVAPDSLQVGCTVGLHAQTGGLYYQDDDVEWVSSNPSIATVSSSGIMTGIKPGEVTISATLKSLPSRERSVEMVVKGNLSDAVVDEIPIQYAKPGASVEPKVVVRYGGKILTEGIDYTVEYYRNDSYGQVWIEGIGLYAGVETASFQIRGSMCTVQFDSNGGSSITPQMVETGFMASRPTDPTKTGCTFKGWFSDKGLTKAYDFSSAVEGDLTLYAKWEANSYTVSFQPNGGTAVRAQAVKYGAKAAKPGDPSRAGYAFGGWFSDKGLTKAYDFSSAVKGDLTLYAKWQQEAPTSFRDVPSGEWYATWVSQAAQRGLMTGLKDDAGNYTGYFDPESPVTRAQVATVLWRIAGSPSCSGGVLWDVRGHWAQEAVAWCASKGVVTGYTDGPNAGCFLPDNQVTREELATMVYRFAKWAGVKVSNPPKGPFDAASDTGAVSPWARDAMVWCGASGVLTGFAGGDRPLLLPQGTAARAQAAKIFTQMDRLAGGEAAPYSEEEADAPVAVGDRQGDAAEQPGQGPQLTCGETESGLCYAVVPDMAAGSGDNAGQFVVDQWYEDLAGRYVGPGVYVTSYKGEAAELMLPAQIGGVDVVSANLAWKGDDEAGAPDPEGRTRLAGLTVERGCGLVSLDASGNRLEQVGLSGDESLGGLGALRFLDLSGNPLSSFDPSLAPALENLSLSNCPLDAECIDALSAWKGATGLAADLTGCAAKDEQAPGSSDADAASPEEPGSDAPETTPADPAEPGDGAGAPAQGNVPAGSDGSDIPAEPEPSDGDDQDVQPGPSAGGDSADGPLDSPEADAGQAPADSPVGEEPSQTDDSQLETAFDNEASGVVLA